MLQCLYRLWEGENQKFSGNKQTKKIVEKTKNKPREVKLPFYLTLKNFRNFIGFPLSNYGRTSADEP